MHAVHAVHGVSRARINFHYPPRVPEEPNSGRRPRHRGKTASRALVPAARPSNLQDEARALRHRLRTPSQPSKCSAKVRSGFLASPGGALVVRRRHDVTSQSHVTSCRL